MRVAIVFDNFGPYHMARLAAAARRMQVLAVEVAAASNEYDWRETEMPQGVERVRLLDDDARRSDWPLLAAAFQERVAPWRPDAIALPGWSAPASLVGAQWAARHAVPAVVMSASNAGDFPRRGASEFVKRRLLTLFRAGIGGGTLARSYLETLGIPPERTFVGYDVVDNGHFAAGPAQDPPDLDPTWRGRFFLAIARFVEKKNLPRLVEAFARYRQAAGVDAWPLVLLGDGPMRAVLEEKRAALGLVDVLLMPGFKQYGELPAWYGAAGAFVHASTTEQWGLVVNEAMAAGLPVLVSERCGCAPDLVEGGRNGYALDPLDAEVWTRLMLELSSGACNRAAMGRASREIIARWSPDAFANGLVSAVEAALHAPVPRPGLFDRTLLWALSRR